MLLKHLRASALIPAALASTSALADYAVDILPPASPMAQEAYDLHWGKGGAQVADLYVVPAHRGLGLALGLGPLVVGEVAPLLHDLATGLLEGAFDAIAVHETVPPALIPACAGPWRRRTSPGRWTRSAPFCSPAQPDSSALIWSVAYWKRLELLFTAWFERTAKMRDCKG